MTCYLCEKELAERADAVIAATLVHEAVHARLQRAGLRYWPDLRPRIEAVCVREEIAFVRLLAAAGFTDTERWLAWLDRRLQRYTKPLRLRDWSVRYPR